MRPSIGVVALFLAASAAMGAEEPPRVDPSIPEAYRATLDSIMALPDDQWEVPPGVNREQFIEFMRRFARSPDSMYIGPDRAHRTDAQMRTFFDAHELDFVRLVAMFEADSALERVFGPDFPIYRPPSKLPPDRQRAYDDLMRRLEVRMLVRLETGTVLLRTTTVHTFDRRGYAFARKAPARLVTTETIRSGDGPVIVYRHMKNRWYTYFQEAT